MFFVLNRLELLFWLKKVFSWPFHSSRDASFHLGERHLAGPFQASAAGFLGRQQTVFVLS